MGTGHIAIVATLTLAGCPRDAGEPATSGSEPTSTARPTSTALPTSTAPPTATSTALPTATARPEAGTWVGTWISAGCGERKYPRVLELAADGTARGRDEVSPCPPKVACVWSGIIPFEGTWEGEGDRVTLTLRETAYQNMKHPPLPTELTWAGAPVGVESGETCPYRPR